MLTRLRLASGALLAFGAATALVGCGGARPEAARTIPVRVVQTNGSLTQRMAAMPALRFQFAPARGVETIHVDDAVHYQRIAGFGASMTDSSAWLLYARLSAAARQAAMTRLFGATGIHLGFIRLPIGASDYVAGRNGYTYDDLPAGQSDPGLTRFSIAHDQPYVIPALKDMLAINPGVEILASPWTAPAWMKANHRLTNVLKRGTLLPNAYGPFARYFVKFIEAYAAAGVPIQAVTPQNEPQLPVNYPGMTLTEPMEARFITHDLKPALSRAGLRTRIYGFDFNWFLTGYPRALVSDRAVLRDIAGLAWHCYVGRASDMTTLHRLAPRLDELETECSSGISAGPASELVIASTRNWAASVVLWNLALDTKGGPHLPQSGCQGCTAIATVDPRAQTVSYGHDYYELGQASAFVERGAWRIASNNFVQYRFVFKTKDGPYESPGLDDVAFENPDGTIVLLAFNNSRHPIRFAVSWRGRSFRYTLPSAATVTFTWR